jgi:hypothetical protein
VHGYFRFLFIPVFTLAVTTKPVIGIRSENASITAVAFFPFLPAFIKRGAKNNTKVNGMI